MKFELFNLIKRWLTGCLLFFWISCTTQTEPEGKTDNSSYYQRIDSVKPLIQNGDLIFRNGTDEVSKAARSMNRIDTSFSHCGILLIENNNVFVYHAIGGSYNPSQKLRRDPIDSFLVPKEADRFAVYRYELATAENDSLSAVVRRFHRAGIRFDMYFNFLSDETMYCSEFVFKSLDKALSGELAESIKAREWPFGISPDDLFLYKKSRLIKRVDF
jgi:hypothetical protein